VARYRGGTIVIVDWRGDALPKEPNKLQPAIVVEDEEQVGLNWPNTIVVPITADDDMAVPGLSVTIDPTPENGCLKRCHALALLVTTVSLQRVRGTASCVTGEQLGRLRGLIAEAIGVG
jgi:mRNA interferase MazF